MGVEAIDVRDDIYEVFDSEGTRLQFVVISDVKVELIQAEAEPDARAELRVILEQVCGPDPNASLGELVARAQRTHRYIQAGCGAFLLPLVVIATAVLLLIGAVWLVVSFLY